MECREMGLRGDVVYVQTRGAEGKCWRALRGERRDALCAVYDSTMGLTCAMWHAISTSPCFG